jgi:hypothetical protein
MRIRTKYGATAGGATVALVALRGRVPSLLWWGLAFGILGGLGGWAWRYIASPE